MTKKFARLEDTEHGQVLIYLERGESSDGQEGPVVIIRGAEIQGVTSQLKLGPWSDDDQGWELAQKCLEAADLAAAGKSFADEVTALMKGTAT